jgi:hypothetical protein
MKHNHAIISFVQIEFQTENHVCLPHGFMKWNDFHVWLLWHNYINQHQVWLKKKQYIINKKHNLCNIHDELQYIKHYLITQIIWHIAQIHVQVHICRFIHINSAQILYVGNFFTNFLILELQVYFYRLLNNKNEEKWLWKLHSRIQDRLLQHGPPWSFLARSAINNLRACASAGRKHLLPPSQFRMHIRFGQSQTL